MSHRNQERRRKNNEFEGLQIIKPHVAGIGLDNKSRHVCLLSCPPAQYAY